MAAHQHWRINITALNNTGQGVLAELEMRTSLGGASVCTGGTPSALNAVGSAASNAFDGSTATAWMTSLAPSLPTWLRYSFAAPVDIVEVALKPHASYLTNTPKDFDLEWSDDGTTWTTLFSVSGLTTWTAGTVYTANAAGLVPARVSAQSLEVLSVSAASLRVSAQSLEALTGTYQIRVPKTYALAVVGPASNQIALQKSYALAVLHDPTVAPVSGTYNISQSIQNSPSNFNTGNGELDMSRLYVREAGTIVSLTYFAGSTQLVGMPVIYASSGSATGMGSRLWYGTEVTVPVNSSLVVECNLAIASAQELWVGFHSKLLGTHVAYTRLDVDGAGASVNPGLWKTQTYGTPPAGPVTGATSFNRCPSLQVMFAPTTNTDRTLGGADAPNAATTTRLSLADELALRKITFSQTVYVNKLRLWSDHWALNCAVKPVIYADSSGVPGARLALGPAVTALYPGSNDLLFSSDVTLASGTYWFGWVPSVNMYGEVASGLTDATSWKIVAGQYASPPNPAPGSMTVGTQSLGVAISYSTTAVASSRRRSTILFPC